MAISNAVNLANLSSGDALTVDSQNDRVGIATTTPTEALTVVGVVSATSFFGDGSNLEGVASAGLGTALGESGGLDVIYYTDKVLTISDTITVDPPATTNIAYTQYSEIAVDENKDLIVADGDDLVPDILGLSTEGVTPLVGAGGRVRADNFTNKAGNGAPNFPSGLTGNVTGNITGTTGTFSGSVSVGGTLTYEDVTNIDSVGVITARSDVSIADKIIHTGDTNTAIRFPAADTFTVETAGSERTRVTSGGDIGIGNVTSPSTNIEIRTDANDEGVLIKSTGSTSNALDFDANRSGAGNALASIRGKWNGTTVAQVTFLAGSDTTNKDDGAITFGTESAASNGNVNATERLRITSAGAAIFKGGLAEKYENAGTTLGSQPNNPLSDGNVILFTGNESGNKTINFTGVHSTLSNGETVSFTAIITPNSSGVINVVQVDGQAITVKWSGGSVPSAGSSGQDIYQFQILKTGTGTSDYTVYGAATNYA